MKKVVYGFGDGIHIFTPVEGSRLANAVTLADETVLASEVPVPVDSFLRGWPVPGVVVDWAETESEWIDRLIEKCIPEGATDTKIVDADSIPDDRTFRAAWRIHPKDGCVVDMDVAREVHKERLRELRAPKLEALDVEYLRALEQGDSARMSEIIAEKNALRDVTNAPGLISASTPEELKAVVPEILK